MSWGSSLKGSQLDGYFKRPSVRPSVQKKEVEEKKSESLFSAGTYTNIPNDARFHIAAYLDPQTLINIYPFVNKEHNSISNEIIGGYIKPELRPTGNVRVLFQTPQNRLDRYVPIDRKGLN